MLSNSAMAAFAATADAAKARAFYAGTLGLTLVSEDPFALVFDANGTTLRVQKVKTFTPQPFTALGWQVADIQAEVRALVAAGVEFMRVPGLPQADDGVWTSPSGAQVAWFQDPDGNILSVAEMPIVG